MAKTLTDRKILRQIYDLYYEDFIDKNKSSAEENESNIYITIDNAEISNALKFDKELIHGRLFDHINEKYGYELVGGRRKNLFKHLSARDQNQVHFPLLSAVLADLEESQLRSFTMPVLLSTLALIISVTSILVSILCN